MSSLFPHQPLEAETALQRLYDRLAERFPLGPGRVRLSRRKLTGGEILYGPPHRITISWHLSESQRRDTLLHEAAHAWAFSLQGSPVGHGPLFRRLALRLGAREGHAPLTEALRDFRRKRQVLYRCEGCSRIFRRFRAFRGARFCVACEDAGRPSRLRRMKE